MMQEVLETALETAEKNEFTKTHFTAFQLSNGHRFFPSPDVAIQEEEEEEVEEIEEDDEWDDDDGWEDDDWDDEEWEDEEVNWDDEEWTEEDD